MYDLYCGRGHNTACRQIVLCNAGALAGGMAFTATLHTLDVVGSRHFWAALGA